MSPKAGFPRRRDPVALASRCLLSMLFTAIACTGVRADPLDSVEMVWPEEIVCPGRRLHYESWIMAPGAPYSIGNRHRLTDAGQEYAIGDFDGDGAPDVAILEVPRSHVLPRPPVGIWLNQGELRFALRDSIPPCEFVAAADFDSDGLDDLVAGAPSSVIVYRAIGGGAFVPYRTLAGVRDARYAAVADLDRDRRPDIVVGDAGGDTPELRAYLHRDGLEPVSFARAIPTPWTLAVGDFNGDGWCDVAVSHHEPNSPGVRSGLVLAPGAIAGFGESVTLSGDGFLYSLASVDLDRDGADDLVSGSLDGPAVWWGDRAAPLLARDAFPEHGLPCCDGPRLSVGADDIDGDGWPDLLLPVRLGTRVLRNVGGRRFEQGPAWYAGTSTSTYRPAPPHWFALVDLDQDGLDDVLQASVLGIETLTSVRGLGPGVFGGLCTFDIEAALSRHPLELVAIDFDGRGRHDLIASGAAGSVVFRQLSDGGFAAPEPFPVRGSIRTAVLDRDRRTDIVTSLGDSFHVYRTRPNGTLHRPADYVGHLVSLSDFDGDGSVDALARRGDRLQVRFNDGRGRFGRAGPLWPNFQETPRAFADMDGDGRADVVFATSEGNRHFLEVHRGRGDGRFEHSWTVELTERGLDMGGTAGTVVGDLDADGDLDFIASYGGRGITWAQADALINPGDGRLRLASNFPVFGEDQQLYLGDFNLDGLPDLANFGHGTPGLGRFHLRLNIGGGRFGDLVSQYAVLSYLRDLVTGDFNGDRLPDIAFLTHSPDALDRVAVAYNVLGPAGRPRGHTHARRAAPEEQEGEVNPLAIVWHAGGRRFAPELDLTLAGSAPARVEVFDLSGRRLWSETLAGGPGSVRLGLPDAAIRASGVVWVRVTQDARRAVAKIPVLR